MSRRSLFVLRNTYLRWSLTSGEALNSLFGRFLLIVSKKCGIIIRFLSGLFVQIF